MSRTDSRLPVKSIPPFLHVTLTAQYSRYSAAAAKSHDGRHCSAHLTQFQAFPSRPRRPRSVHARHQTSSAPGQGASFQVFLPTTPLAVVETVEPREPERWTTWRGARAVLVVDDEAVVRAMVRSILEHCGLTVLDAEDGREGLAVYQQHRDDIVAVVLDMTMPYMNGEEVYRELRRINPNARIILSSGYSEQEALAAFTGAGLAGFIQKPYMNGALIDKVRTTLQEARRAHRPRAPVRSSTLEVKCSRSQTPGCAARPL